MKLAKTIAYWTSTSLIALAMLASGGAYLSGSMDEAMVHLGYPASFVLLLGVWKLLGGVALLIPALPRAKEWVYAGFFFTLTGAIVSHIGAGDGATSVIAPTLMIGLLAASYFLRPTKLWALASVVGHGVEATPAK